MQGSRSAKQPADILQDPRWKMLLRRDRNADGKFVFSVKTTGVYCRPSCPARRGRPEHVAFHNTAQEAEVAGFRPCRRCRPNGPSPAAERTAIVVGLCQLLESEESVPAIQALAARAGWSVSYLQRTFKAVTGRSPAAYAAGLREARVRAALAKGTGVTEAFYGAGYNSGGRFYETAARTLGMKPGEFRRGGEGVDIRFATAPCSMGYVLAAATPRGICAIFLGDETETLIHDLRRRFAKATILEGDRDFQQMLTAVVAFVDAPAAALDLPLDIRGTAFQQRVWQALQEIPPGKTVSYTEIARRIEAPKSVRAVAGAIAANPVAVAIPCHRVIREDGDLSGYRWGVQRKRALLDRERKK